MASEGASLDVDLLAASLRADADDLGVFVESLARKLEDALGSRVKVERGRRGMLGPKLVRRIALDAGDFRLELLRSDRDEIETRRCRLSGGIVLKRDDLGPEAWLTEVSQALATEAGKNERARQALERLLIN